MRGELKSLGRYLLLELPEILIVTVLILILRRFIHLSLWMIGLAVLVLFLKALIVYPRVRKVFSQKPYTGVESVVGATGKVVETLNPEGIVKIRGELWTAESKQGKIRKGEDIEVVAVSGSKLIVKNTGTI